MYTKNMSKKYLDSKGLSYLWQKITDKYLQKQSLPNVENELIYFDDETGFISNQLLSQDDVLFVNTQEDYDLCSKNERVESDVLGSWQQFQCNTNNSNDNINAGKYNKTISPEYGKGVLGNTTGASHPASGYGWWYKDGTNIKNDINSGDFNGYIMPFSKNRYSFDTLFGCHSTASTSGDQIGFSIVNDKNALPRRVETTDGIYYRNTLYDKLIVDNNNFKHPSQSAWVKEDKINNTAKVIFTAGPTVEGDEESFPTVDSNFTVYDIENIRTSAGRKKPVKSNTFVKITSTHEAAGYLGFLTVVVTNSNSMDLAQGVGVNCTSGNTGTIYVFGSVFDINTKKWNSTKIIDGSSAATGDYWKLGKNLVEYNDAYNGNDTGKTCIIRCNASYNDGKLEISFGDPVAYTNKDTADFNGSKLSFDFKKKTYSFESYHEDGSPIHEIKHDISLPNFTPTVYVDKTITKNLSNDDFWNLFTGDTKFMYNAYSYEYLYIEVLNMLTDNKIIWVHEDGTNTEYALNSKRTEYVSKGNIQAKDGLTGSRLSYNPITKKLFYSNGEKIYQIAGGIIDKDIIDNPTGDITNEQVKYFFDSILNSYSFEHQREITENIKVRRLEDSEKQSLSEIYGVDWDYINLDNKIQEGAKGKLYANEINYIDEISDIKYVNLSIGGTLFNCNSIIIPEDDYNVYDFTYKYLSGVEGTNAFAEGDATLANGNSSHAEGEWNTAYGDYSHAEGESTTSQGQASHAEGEDTLAIGDASHAEGSHTLAVGDYSHTEGFDTVAKNAYEHSQGAYNVSNKETETFGDKNTIFSVGIGKNSEDRKNALEVLQNGDVYINGIGDYDGTNALKESDITGKIARSLQEASSDTPGYTYVKESNAFIEGENHEWLNGAPTPYKVHKLSDEEKEVLDFSGSIGIDYDYCINCEDNAVFSIIYDDNKVNLQNTKIKECSGCIGVDGNIIIETPNTDSFLGNIKLKFFNLNLYDENDEAIILENDTEYYFSYPDVGFNVHIEGSGSIGIGDYSHVEGYKTIASGNASHAEGNNTLAQGNSSHAEGSGTIGMGFASHVEGQYTTAEGESSHSEGVYTKAKGNYSHAEGSGTIGIGSASHAEGSHTEAIGYASHAEGAGTTASGVASHSEGAKYGDNRSTESAGQASHAEGASTYAKADGSHTEGILNIAGRSLDEISTAAQELGISGTPEELAAKLLGYGAHAEGMNNEALGSCSHSEGNVTKALANSTHAEGDTTIAFGEASHAEGYNTQAKGNQSHAEGSNTVAIGNSSHTEGASTTASGSFSHAEGSHTEASGRDSHAEGAYNKAIGIASHAEGDHTIAEGETSHTEGFSSVTGGTATTNDLIAGTSTDSGAYAHAEGNATMATGIGAHSEGQKTFASGTASHAEGANTTASGSNSHAEGYSAKAQGNYSHAEGFNTKASGSYSHAEGQTTTASGSNSHTEGYNTTTGGTATTNNLTIGTSTDSGAYAHAEGNATIAKGISSHSEGQKTFASGKASHAEGANTTASGNYSHAEGYSAKAQGSYSHAEGYNTKASGKYSHAEGLNNLVSGDCSHTEGANTTVEGSWSHAEGYNTTVTRNCSHAEGDTNIISGEYSHAEGRNNTLISAPCSHIEGNSNALFLSNSHAEGSENISHGYISHIEGDFNTVTGYAAHAEGFGNIASGDSAHVEGGLAYGVNDYKYDVELNSATYNSSTGVLECVTKTEIPDDKLSSCIAADFRYGTGSWDFKTYWISNIEKVSTTSYKLQLHADALSCIINGIKPNPSTIGTIIKLSLLRRGNIASGNSSHAEGKNTTASGKYSHAEGYNTVASEESAHAEGTSTIASGETAHAEGHQTQAIGNGSHAEGAFTTAQDDCSHAEGSETIASGVTSHAEGGFTIASGDASHAEGMETTASGETAHAEGSSTNAEGDASHAEGNWSHAKGNSSHAEGYSSVTGGTATTNDLTEGTNTTSGAYAHAEGNATIAKGVSSHSEGQKTFASGNGSHAEGAGTTASGDCSHAEGSYTEATGRDSHAEGAYNNAIGGASHAEGDGTTAEGRVSHAEGVNTIAHGDHSHAEGNSTIAGGQVSHAEGRWNTAYGDYSHAEGNNTTANGRSSHAEGYSTITNNEAEHAEGKYNKSNTGTISSIGIGTNSTDRKNAFEVMQNGDTYLINVGGYDGTNSENENSVGVKAKSLQEIIDNSTQLKVKLDLKRFYVGEYENAQELYIGFPSGTDVTDFELEIVRWGSVKYRISTERNRKTVLKYTGEHKIKNISETPTYIPDWTHDKDLFQVKIGEHGYDRDGYSYYRVLGKVISQNANEYFTEYVGMLEYINISNNENNTKFLPIRYKNQDGSFKIPAQFFNKKNNGICVRFNNKTISKMVKFGTIFNGTQGRIKI